jgi:transcriptional regulator with GAF, ATPase, and Fis domain
MADDAATVEQLRAELRQLRELRAADQAEIAALQNEKDSLVNEVGWLRPALTEALDQQTATAEVLRVIASTPTDRTGVLAAVVASSKRLCGAEVASIARVDGDEHTLVASTDAALVGHRSRARGTIAERTVRERRTIHVAETPEERRATFPDQPISPNVGFWGKAAMTPLLRDGQVIGTLNITRREVRPFGEREIALLETFADQAVIAIENARLFENLTEALERQTATSEILRVIASSPQIWSTSSAWWPNVLRDSAMPKMSRSCGSRVLSSGALQRTGYSPGQRGTPPSP